MRRLLPLLAISGHSKNRQAAPSAALYIVGPVTWLGGLVPFLIAACIGAPLFLLLVLWQVRKGRKLAAGGRS